MADKIVYRYWGIRGLGQVGRLLLSYTETPWENKLYTSHDDWFVNDKPKAGGFANLPNLTDGDFVLNESEAIARYVIRRSKNDDMLGKDAKEIGRVDEAMGIINESMVKALSLIHI